MNLPRISFRRFIRRFSELPCEKAKRRPTRALHSRMLGGEPLEQRLLLALTPFDLGQLLADAGGDGSDGTVLIQNTFRATASTVSSAGDVNGDDIGDFLIGAPNTGNPSNSGQIFVVFGTGSSLPAEFNLRSLDGTNGFVIAGSLAEIWPGRPLPRPAISTKTGSTT